MTITYYGHSCFGVKTNNCSILFDPFIRPNELAKDIDIDRIAADFIVVTHGHEDHIADLEYIAKRTNAKVISNFEIIQWCSKMGIENVHAMNTGGQFAFEFGTIKSVFAAHSSSLPDGSYGGNPNGYIIKSDGKSIYYAGDTALSNEMKLIGDYDHIDLAFLPIGDNFTMGVKDAITAAGFVGCNEVIGMHYDTFPPIKLDGEKAIKDFNSKGVNLQLMTIGATIEI